MGSKRIIYFLLSTYLLGNVLLVFIQYNWAKNLNTLIQGNERLVNEFTISGRVKELERDVLSLESGIRGAINTNDTTFVANLEMQIAAIDGRVDLLRRQSGHDSSIRYLPLLSRLVRDKLLFSRLLFHTFLSNGKSSAEHLIATQKGKHLTDSILATTAAIELSRERHLAAVTSSTDVSGTNALHLGIILIAFVLLCGAFVFWYIINTIRRQIALIDQLNISEKREREAAKVKENFLANMSHEIRTPMNAILGFTHLLQRKKEMDSEARQFVQTIHRSGENLLAIINDILDLSKIESGMMRIETTPFALRGLVQSVETMFRAKAAEKGLQVETEFDEALPDTLEGDPVRLTQVLVNLVGNAVKFTQAGRVRIAVRKERENAGSIDVGFSIEDTGIGIEKENLAAIFERFQQAEGSVTRKYGGTGLGLSIARDLVQLQGGAITVESEVHKGTTFHFIIPYAKTAAESPAPNLPRQRLQVDPLVSALSVLIVEDNEINQSLLQTIFRHWLVDCTVAANGREAVDMLTARSFDVVLMDIQMPQMDGYTATGVIRNELQSDIPIIAMTAHAMAGEREKCLAYGMNEYISKPVREEQLYQLLLQFTGKSTPAPLMPAGNTTAQQGYGLIQLGYMKEISAGDTAYEKLVTEQFLELLPADLATLQLAWQEGNIALLRQTAHNMKTTVSVMGLNEALQPFLDTLEYEHLTTESFAKTYEALSAYCARAVNEAEAFYRTLT